MEKCHFYFYEILRSIPFVTIFIYYFELLLQFDTSIHISSTIVLAHNTIHSSLSHLTYLNEQCFDNNEEKECFL